MPSRGGASSGSGGDGLEELKGRLQSAVNAAATTIREIEEAREEIRIETEQLEAEREEYEMARDELQRQVEELSRQGVTAGGGQSKGLFGCCAAPPASSAEELHVD